jgi:uncharacterized lipoprotein
MHLSASLTKRVVTAVLILGLAACANNGPKRPSSAQDKSANQTLAERCSDYEMRGMVPPPECPQATTRPQSRQRTRPVPELPQDPLLNPGLPGATLPQPMLGR